MQSLRCLLNAYKIVFVIDSQREYCLHYRIKYQNGRLLYRIRRLLLQLNCLRAIFVDICFYAKGVKYLIKKYEKI
jgi:hypothetical protein